MDESNFWGVVTRAETETDYLGCRSVVFLHRRDDGTESRYGLAESSLAKFDPPQTVESLAGMRLNVWTGAIEVK